VFADVVCVSVSDNCSVRFLSSTESVFPLLLTALFFLLVFFMVFFFISAARFRTLALHLLKPANQGGPWE